MSKDSSSKIPNEGLTLHEHSRTSKLAHATVLTGSVILLFIFVQIIVALISGVVLLLAGVDPDAIENTFLEPHVLLMYSLLVDAILIGALYSIYKFWQKDFWKSIHLRAKMTKKILLTSIKFYVLYFVGFGLLWFFVERYVPIINTEQTQDLGFADLTGIEYLYGFIALVVLPPIAEEILFRGVLYTRLKHFISLRAAAVVVSIVFGMAHLELLGGGPPNWIAGLDTFVFSFFLIYAYEKTGSLKAPILIHALKNCIAYFAVFVF